MTNLLPRIEFLAQALVKRGRTCPHCDAADTRVVARKSLVVRVRECTSCSLYFTDPVYERSVFGALYDNLYGAEGSTTAVPEPETLAELMQTSFRGTDKDCHARLKTLRELAPGKRLVEVGSSWGYFLHQAANEGFEPTGVELSGPRRAVASDQLGQRLVSSFDELKGERFDVVYTAHTLEHFTDFRGVLGRLRDLLESGGLLAIEVPNFDFAHQGSDVLSTIGAVHPLGFTSEFFQTNLARAGFEDLQFFDRWDDVPGTPVDRCTSDVVIVLAKAGGRSAD